jgi:hypothetical protein
MKKRADIQRYEWFYKCNPGRREPTFIGMELRCPGFSNQLRIGLGNEHSNPLIEGASFVRFWRQKSLT